MRPAQVEQWTIAVADRVRSGAPLEDSRVELKAEWPEPEKAARRIAGHANAAHGDSILWIIGLDEKRGAIGAAANNLATWYAQVQSQFDGVAPPMLDLNVPYEGVTLVALLFDTTRAPFVVQNPAFNKPGGGSVSLETPWREGTSVRSATRTDLIRLLVPLQTLPDVEILRIEVRHSLQENRSRFDVTASLYIVPRSGDRVVIPTHRCVGATTVLGETMPFEWWGLNIPTIPVPSPVAVSQTLRSTISELIVDGPGQFTFSARSRSSRHITDTINEIEVVVELRPVLADVAIVIKQTVPKHPRQAVSTGEFLFPPAR